jgi:putative transposase
MRDHDISQRRACRLVGVDPKTVRREHSPDNPEVREEMQAIASKRRRFGYRRIGVLLERKGMNQTGFSGDVGVRHSAAILAVSSAL